MKTCGLRIFLLVSTNSSLNIFIQNFYIIKSLLKGKKKKKYAVITLLFTELLVETCKKHLHPHVSMERYISPWISNNDLKKMLCVRMFLRYGRAIK